MSKRKLRSYIVRVRETLIREYVVDAESADDARENYDQPDSDVAEIKCVDWEVEKVEANE